jgi:hypothetical protein
VLAGLAQAAADAGDPDRAQDLAKKAKAAAQAVTDPAARAEVLADLARPTASNLDRAEAAARSITDPSQQARAFANLARAAGDAGDLDRAEAAARSITDPSQQAQALAELARKAEPGRARALLAWALTTGHWLASVNILVKISPAAVISIADEYLNAMPHQKAPSPDGT